ncbi:MAG TPA: hypothetical protein VFU21_25400 [Kofleriaceae bacterium]|nr:hypothetical protein [Kofleriaceae bacterium]
MDQCEICRARVRELRRGRCWGCYSRWVEARPVGLGAVCRICGERRRSYLKSIELLGAWAPVCHACAGRIGSLEGLPRSVAGIRALLGRERRSAVRRVGRPDGRAFPYERRGLERRADEIHIEIDTGDARQAIEDDMVVEIAELAHELEVLAEELPGADLTFIRELPR